MAMIDWTGKKAGRWTVERLDEVRSGKVKYWLCVCECGTRKSIIAWGLSSGGSLSCGCLNRERSSQKHTKHGMKNHPAYRSWRAMRKRCELVNATGYADYGGRGIAVCDKWQTFEGFWEDMGPTWAPGLSLDRIDVNGMYERRNCRWATDLQQGNNRRNNNVIPTPIGPMTVSDAAREYGINRNTIFRRIRDGWDRSKLLQPAEFHPRWHKEE